MHLSFQGRTIITLQRLRPLAAARPWHEGGGFINLKEALLHFGGAELPLGG